MARFYHFSPTTIGDLTLSEITTWLEQIPPLRKAGF